MNPLSQLSDTRPSRPLLRNLLPLAFTVAVLAILAFSSPASAASSSPSFSNVQMSQVGAFGAEISATLDPGDQDAYYFAAYELQTPPAGEGTTGWVTNTEKIAGGSGPTPIGIPLPDLASGTAYTVHLTALDGAGNVVDSEDIPFTTVALGANGVAITDFNASDVSTNYAEISAISHTADGIGNSSCTVAYVDHADYDATASDPYASGSSLPCNPSSLTQNTDGSVVGAWIWGLSPGTAYDYRYVVTNAEGSWASDDQTFTTSPLAPTVSVAVPGTIGTTSATFSAAIDTGNGATTCDAQIVTAADADAHLSNPFGDARSVECNPASIPPGVGGSASATFTGLLPNVAYRVRFAVANASGAATGADTRFTTAALAPSIDAVQATDLSASTASVKASVDPNGVGTSVYVRYGTPGHTDGSATVALPASSTDQTVTIDLKGLTADTDYGFQVVALSSAGTTESAEQTLHTLATPPPPPPAIPGVPSITSGPAKETFDPVAAFFFTGDGNGFVCAVDGGAWTPCSSGDDFGPASPGDHTFAVRALGVGGLQSEPAAYSWTVVNPDSCVVETARARLFLNPIASKVRLVLHYKSSKKALVSVDFATAKGKVRQRIGRATAKFKTKGVYRLPRRVSKSTMAQLLAAKRFNVQLDVHGEVPGLCSRYFSRDLTVRKRVGGQIIVFQKGSAFGPGPLVTAPKS